VGSDCDASGSGSLPKVWAALMSTVSTRKVGQRVSRSELAGAVTDLKLVITELWEALGVTRDKRLSGDRRIMERVDRILSLYAKDVRDRKLKGSQYQEAEWQNPGFKARSRSWGKSTGNRAEKDRGA